MSKKAIVIGAGIGGLSSAIRLKCKGYDVDVFEKSHEAGGKLTSFTLGEYRFDFGPSLFTMPSYVDELFHLAGRNPRKYFDYIDLPEACRYFFPDGTTFEAPTDPRKFAKRAAKTFNVDETKINKYFAYNEKIFNQSGAIFLNNSVHKLKTFLNTKALKAAVQAYVIELFRSMNKANEKAFKNEKLVQLFNRYATYNGSSPYQAPAILNSISVLEHLHGTYYPQGGMSNISKALFKLAEEIGIRFHFNTMVDEILYENRKIIGVRCASSIYNAGLVISNMDVQFTYDILLSKHKTPSFYKNREKSSSAVIFYWGIKEQIPGLGLHNIFFAMDYKDEFSKIFKGQNPSSDPTIYINNTSIFSPEDAPKGGSNLFVMINAPAQKNIDIKELKKNVISKLDRELKVEMRTLIEEERIVTPAIIESQTMSHKGALYGSSSNTWVNAFLRHPNFSSKLKGLYFVGGSVHPGGGIPLCLLSSKIAIEMING